MLNDYSIQISVLIIVLACVLFFSLYKSNKKHPFSFLISGNLRHSDDNPGTYILWWTGVAAGHFIYSFQSPVLFSAGIVLFLCQSIAYRFHASQ